MQETGKEVTEEITGESGKDEFFETFLQEEEGNWVNKFLESGWPPEVPEEI